MISTICILFGRWFLKIHEHSFYIWRGSELLDAQINQLKVNGNIFLYLSLEYIKFLILTVCLLFVPSFFTRCLLTGSSCCETCKYKTHKIFNFTTKERNCKRCCEVPDVIQFWKHFFNVPNLGFQPTIFCLVFHQGPNAHTKSTFCLVEA